METEGRKSEQGGLEPGTNDNVVPFPRDWLGPREELIPFGSSAEQSADAPGAEAFWGGECDPLDAVVATPAPAPAIAGRHFQPLGSRWRFQPLGGRLAVGALVVALLAAAVFGRIAGVPTGASGPAVGSNVAAAGFFDLALLRGAVGTPTVEASKRAVHHGVRPRRRPAAHPAHVRQRATMAARGSGTGSTATASSTTSVAAAPATSSQPVSSTPSSSATTGSTATSSASTHSSVSSHTANVRPGPVGPGAPFGPGQLK